MASHIRKSLLLLIVCVAASGGVLRAQIPLPQEPVPATYFWMRIHMAATTTAWPDVPFKTWRLWDAGVAWSPLEPACPNFPHANNTQLAAAITVEKWDQATMACAPPDVVADATLGCCNPAEEPARSKYPRRLRSSGNKDAGGRLGFAELVAINVFNAGFVRWQTGRRFGPNGLI